MKYLLPKGETNLILIVFIQDSSSTTGAGLAGLSETSSIAGGFLKRGGLGVALTVDEAVATEGTYQAPSATGKVRIGTPANMPAGFYELHFHNDLFTTADYVAIGLGGATNMAPLNLEIQLTTADLNADPIELADIPTAVENAAEVRTDLTTELGRIDVATSTRNATAPDNAGITDIKTKTDQMTFTNANELDGNMKSINDATVTGDGNATPWDGA